MAEATVQPGPTRRERRLRESRLTADEARFAQQDLRRRRLTAVGLVAPLFLFVIFAFFAPIATMLHRSVYNPTVVQLIPDTLASLASWNGEGTPDAAVLTTMAVDLKRLQGDRTAGRFGEALNRALPGSSSLVKSTARRLGRLDDAELTANGGAVLLEINERWAAPELWISIQRLGHAYTIDNYLTALDLERAPDGTIRERESAQIYVALYTKTLRIALVITVLCLILGYPLSFYLANAPPTTANLLMILVLLPFWTSLLVRTTAWIVLLQTNGVVNSVLMAVGITGEPLEMLYTEFATIVAMTHILLPFMVLPLYSVMKGIDPSYMRAAMSLGSPPIPAFLRVYLPMTMPGVSAGALLVFIISVGYYITPALVGGTDGQMISNIIAFHMQQSNNWELAAALGALLLVVIIVLYWVYDLLVGADNLKFS
ncbi:ABC transporter permease [Bauldia sp.]|uniref:ABC transporter permease n=1 Tax=Bauldia sp. TaxID=2575872 RepID=UPI003BAC57A8